MLCWASANYDLVEKGRMSEDGGGAEGLAEYLTGSDAKADGDGGNAAGGK